MITTVNKFILYLPIFLVKFQNFITLKFRNKTSLVVQWFRLWASTARGTEKKEITLICIKRFFSYYLHVNLCSCIVQIIKLRLIEIHLPRRFPRQGPQANTEKQVHAGRPETETGLPKYDCGSVYIFPNKSGLLPISPIHSTLDCKHVSVVKGYLSFAMPSWMSPFGVVIRTDIYRTFTLYQALR